MPTKQWKRNGPEQQHLENLFKTGDISVEDQHKDVYDAYAIFQDFSRETFRKKFADTKNTFILIVENVELIDLKSYFFYFS